MKDSKFPKTYNLLITKELKHSERRVELDKETIKYFSN